MAYVPVKIDKRLGINGKVHPFCDRCNRIKPAKDIKDFDLFGYPFLFCADCAVHMQKLLDSGYFDCFKYGSRANGARNWTKYFKERPDGTNFNCNLLGGIKDA